MSIILTAATRFETFLENINAVQEIYYCACITVLRAIRLSNFSPNEDEHCEKPYFNLIHCNLIIDVSKMFGGTYVIIDGNNIFTYLIDQINEHGNV